jgi:hypothetical protein
MNTKLIDELAAQAWRYSLNYDGEEILPQIKVFHRKLAELVVQECARRVGEMQHVYPHQAELSQQTLLKHWGMPS